MKKDTKDPELEMMIPISINEFISGTKIPVDVFVRLSDQKFICLAKAGAETQKDQLTSYKNKEVHYLWVRKSEYNKVALHTVAIAGLIINQDNIELKTKSTVLTQAANTVFRQFDNAGISLELFQNAKQVTEATVAICETHRDIVRLLESVARFSDQLIGHSLAVSLVSVLIGQEMGWVKKVTLEKLALGGLLHDIGLKTLPKELVNKSLAEMNTEEMLQYETHAYRGMQLMISLGVVPDDVVSIVYEHHENSLGQGYPQRIRDIKIHPLAKVVGLADQFCYLTMKGLNNPNPKNPREAIIYIEHTMGQPFNKDAFRALKRVVEKPDAKVKAA